MTVTEIKDLTKFLSDEEVEKIKEEIKSKENVLKNGSLDEEEMIQVLNTLFAILVIEKTLESEIEGVEEIRAELEAELIESYNLYDTYMSKYKKDDKKKKKRWLLDFLFLSENIRTKKDGLSTTNKTIAKLQNELNTLRQQKSDSNLREVAGKSEGRFNDFCERPEKCKNPRHHHPDISDRMEKRAERILVKRIEEAFNQGKQPRVKPENIRKVVKQDVSASSQFKETMSTEKNVFELSHATTKKNTR